MTLNPKGHRRLRNALLIKSNRVSPGQSPLSTISHNAFGKDCSPFIQITFHKVDEKEIFRISIRPSPKPVFVKDEKGEHLFIRAGNSTRLLSTKEAIEYCKVPWK